MSHEREREFESERARGGLWLGGGAREVCARARERDETEDRRVGRVPVLSESLNV